MTHHDYLHHLKSFFSAHASDPLIAQAQRANAREMIIFSTLDLEPAREFLESHYCPVKRRPPRDPICMLRLFLLMLLCHVKGITAWVKQLRSSPVLAALTGFAPDKIPGVGTCYAFKDRLVNGPYQPPCVHVTRPADDLKTRHTRRLKDKTDDRHDSPPMYHSHSEALSATLQKEADTPRPDSLQSRMEDLLVTLGLLPSIEQGLLGALDQLAVSGDGSILETAASAHGKPSCGCAPEERKSCGHPRSYTSASAQWAYDASKERYVFGDRYYHVSVTVSGRDLPLLTCMPGGNEADQTLSLKALDDLLKLNRDQQLGLTVKTFCGDMHHDTYAHYDSLAAKQITPIIPLRESSKPASRPQFEDRPELKLDEDGTPRCPGNCRMRHYSYKTSERTHVFACPAKRRRGKPQKYVFSPHDCPQRQDCAPQSSCGPFVYLKSSTDRRLYPPLSRETTRFHLLYNQRTSTERLNALNDRYQLDRRSRNAASGVMYLTLANILEHAVARFLDAGKTTPSLLERLDQTMTMVMQC